MKLLDDLRHDLLYAIRTLRKEPTFVAAVVLTLALSIGANAAMVGLIDRLMLSAPPGVRDPQRVAQLQIGFPGPDGESYHLTTTSYPVFRAVAAPEAGFASAAAVHTGALAVGRGAEAVEAPAIAASGDYFEVLGARPALGRFFGPDDDALPFGRPVVVLGHAYWRRQFAGSSGVLGSLLVIDDQEYTVIGVAGAGFTGDRLAPVDLFVPLSAAMQKHGAGWWQDRRINLVSIVGRLREDVTPAAAAPRLVAAIANAVPEHPPESVALASLLPGSGVADSQQGKITLWLGGVALVVLLIATANVATLLLLRAARRRREIAVRVALGVSRGRLALQLLTESLLLSGLGAAAGLLVSWWAAELIRATLLPELAPTERLLDAGVLTATVLAALFVGVAAGLAPMVLAGRADACGDLRSAGSHGSARHSRIQRALVGVQVALCTLLLVGAGLFVRSLQRIEGQDLGFSTARLLVVNLDFKDYVPGAERDRVHEQLALRLAALPGVTATTVTQAMPFGSFYVPPISVPGRDQPPSMGGQLPFMYGATPAYLSMMGVTLREGRLLDERDVRGGAPVVLVNETMAREVWPGESALGRCIRIGFEPGVEPAPLAPASLPCREVIGVVRDSRARSLRPTGNEARLMQFYVPFGQLPSAPNPDQAFVHALLIQTTGDPARMLATVQRLVQGASRLPVYARVQTYEDLLDPQLRPWRLGATLFGALAALALAIAAVGLFGVVSFMVVRRTREIGVRMALGSTRAGAGKLVVGSALGLAGAGSAAGLVTALLVAPAAQSMLFETSVHDAGVMLATVSILLFVAFAAAAIPAWRASRVDPMVALRTE